MHGRCCRLSEYESRYVDRIDDGAYDDINGNLEHDYQKVKRIPRAQPDQDRLKMVAPDSGGGSLSHRQVIQVGPETFVSVKKVSLTNNSPFQGEPETGMVIKIGPRQFATKRIKHINKQDQGSNGNSRDIEPKLMRSTAESDRMAQEYIDQASTDGNGRPIVIITSKVVVASSKVKPFLVDDVEEDEEELPETFGIGKVAKRVKEGDGKRKKRRRKRHHKNRRQKRKMKHPKNTLNKYF